MSRPKLAFFTRFSLFPLFSFLNLIPFLVLSYPIGAIEFISDPQTKDDLYSTLEFMGKASYLQFSRPPSWIYLSSAVPILGYSFHKDKDLKNKYRGVKKSTYLKMIDHLAVASTFPILPVTLYYKGRTSHDSKMVSFSKEYFATLYLALAESGLLSFIPIHRRPSEENLSFWETKFRGPSSFPSGHIIPFAALTFKTFQYYGASWAIAPGILSFLIGQERVKSQKHYLSDVTSAVFLAALASEGVRIVAQNQTNHPFYQWLFENELQVSFNFNQDHSYLGLSFSY